MEVDGGGGEGRGGTEREKGGEKGGARAFGAGVGGGLGFFLPPPPRAKTALAPRRGIFGRQRRILQARARIGCEPASPHSPAAQAGPLTNTPSYES